MGTSSILATAGTITLTSQAGKASTATLTSKGDISITSFNELVLNNTIVSQAGNIDLTSTADQITLNGIIKAESESITLSAHTALIGNSGGITSVTIINPGVGYSVNQTTVTIAAPNDTTLGNYAAQAKVIVDPNTGAILEVVILDPGHGYRPGETPLVTFTDTAPVIAPTPALPGPPAVAANPGDPAGTGATAFAVSTQSLQNLFAQKDISITTGTVLTIVGIVKTTAGDITFESKAGAVDLAGADVLIQATAGSIDVKAGDGTASLRNLIAGQDVDVVAKLGVSLVGAINSAVGNVSLATSHGSLALKPALTNLQSEISAPLGTITLKSDSGVIQTPYIINAGNTVDISAPLTIEVNDTVYSQDGDIIIKSLSGNLVLDAAVRAENKNVDLSAGGAIVGIGGTLTSLTLVSGGGGYHSETILTISPPAKGGGVAATGKAVIVAGVVVRVDLISAGSGYAPGENIAVEIKDIKNLLIDEVHGTGAQAFGTSAYPKQNIYAGDNLNIEADRSITLFGNTLAKDGDLTITSVHGDLALEAETFLGGSRYGKVNLRALEGKATIYQLSAYDGITIAVRKGLVALDSINSTTGNIVIATTNKDLDFRDINTVVVAAAGGVTLTSQNGAIYSPLTHASTDIVMASHGTLALSRPVTSDTGTVTITSTSGAITLAGSIFAGNEAILLTAKLGVTQLAQDTGLSTEMFTVIFPGFEYIYANTKVVIAAPVGGGTAATALPIISNGAITGIRIINPGSGYAVDEQPTVTITADPNPPVGAALPTQGNSAAVSCRVRILVNHNLIAHTDIKINAGKDVTLLNTVRSDTGDITVKTTDGNLELSEPTLFLSALGGKIDLTSTRGSAKLQHISAFGNITMAVQEGLLALNSINSTSGDVTIKTVNRNLDFTPAAALIGCEAGSVTLTSTNGAILSPPVLHVGTNVTISSFATVNLSNDITADFGAVSVTSTYGSIKLGADIFAKDNSISLSAKGEITQVGRGIQKVEVLFGGSGYTTGIETVTINGPGNVAAGGVLLPGQVAATARLVVGSVNGISGRVIGIQILTAGSGYAANEVVDVVIAAPGGLRGTQALATCKAGDATQTQNLIANENVTIKSGFNLNLLGWIRGENGDVSIESSRAVSLGAEIFAGDAISIKANSGITQPAGFVKAHSLTLKNSTNAAVTVASGDNNVEQFAAQTLGALTYFDFDDFETGGVVLPRTGTPAVEIMASALSLSSGDVGSKIRVVSGLTYKTLSIAAGTIGGSSVGTVEFVTTSTLDNPPVLGSPAPAFGGTLRDMINYRNDNSATYLLNGSLLPQPAMMVFDEENYPVEEITVSLALPAFTKPVTFAGDRLESTATTDRLGIIGNNKIKAGLSLGLGSQGSLIRGTAVYGFTEGSGIVIASGNNVVLNTYAGIKADGTSAPNSVGLELTGIAAKANLIGSNIFEETTANYFQANRNAGILIRAGAANNRIFGNIVGSNGDGIRFNAAGGGNQIGTPFEVGPDLMPAVSNEIIGNKLSGIAFINTNATSTAKNTVTNNKIDSNATGITMSASSFAAIGGPASKAANI
ncbi:MAG: hypothetical protein WCI09_12420, partial [Planctomycetota bacterium]